MLWQLKNTLYLDKLNISSSISFLFIEFDVYLTTTKYYCTFGLGTIRIVDIEYLVELKFPICFNRFTNSLGYAFLVVSWMLTSRDWQYLLM